MRQITNLKLTHKEGVSCSFELLKRCRDTAFYQFSYTSQEEEVPAEVTVQWRIPSVSIFSTWNPMTRFERALRTVYTAGIRSESRMNFSAPMQTLIGADGKNVLTFAVSDAVTPLTINTQIYEEGMDMMCQITFFTRPMEIQKHYEAVVRIDFSDIPYYEAIEAVENWWSTECGMTPAKVPEAAKEALYSTWYSYHHDITEEAVVEQCRKAAAMGMKTVILDAGWQMKKEGDPRYGDWKAYNPAVNGLTDMVEKIHGFGMKFVLWFSVPFISKEAEVWSRLGEYVLDDTPGRRWYCLDPRYAQVREYLAEVYEEAIRQWNLDGLKLDFIDSFQLGEYAKREDPRRDYESLEEAEERLLCDISARVKRVNPDIMLEFRQAYIGPKARETGNMLRVSDCPNDALFNRVGLIDLRLLSGRTAIHSDMIGWNQEETPQGCARQLIAVLFGVPQISVRIEELREEQRAALQFYLDFWNANKEILLDGKLIPLNPEMNYSVVEARGENSAIVVCCGKNDIRSEKDWDVYTIVNGSGETRIFLEYEGEEYPAEITIYDCMGKAAAQSSGTIKHGLNSWKIPECGMAVLKKDS
ncbi:MAG: alpha-galactosidase [Lachnospiraceae bacterium]|nr:alpha-galactosidase [Lachnospiraceae bacterium]